MASSKSTETVDHVVTVSSEVAEVVEESSEAVGVEANRVVVDEVVLAWAAAQTVDVEATTHNRHLATRLNLRIKF